MSQAPEGRPAFSQKSAEIVIAALFLIAGALVIIDSKRLGFGWKEVEGPQSGYFPFYIGVIMCAASLVNLLRALWVLRGKRNKGFVEVEHLKLVLTVLVPSALYAAAVAWTGIYVASMVFIAFFMRWLGKYAWWKVVATSIGTMVVFYLIFEIWFKVPLPKGPLENWLGIG